MIGACGLVVSVFVAFASALEIPPLTGRVMDLAHLLPAELAASLDAELAAHEARTGNQVVLLTLPSLQGEPLEEFSHRVASSWELGRKGTDNGVLVLVVPGERKIRIEVGYGLEGVLTDAMASRIIRQEMVPRFRAGDFAGGIGAGVNAVLRTIEGTYQAAPPHERAPMTGGTLAVFVFAVLIGAAVGAGLGIQHRSLGLVGGGALSFLMAISAGVLLALAAAVAGMLGSFLFSTLGIPPRRSFSRRFAGDWAPSGIGGLSGADSFSGGGGFGGGFSGGGGSFGGGGASGSW